MANGGRIDYTIGFNVDKGGLKDLESTLKDLSKMSASNIMKENPGMSMKESMSAMVKLRQSIAEVQGAYNKAFDSKTGILNIEKMQSSLKKLDLNTIQKNFAAVGSKGSETFLKISQSALTANVRFKETNSLINKMGTTLINTLKWTFSSSLINRFTGAIQQAVGYVEHLDSSLNDIRIVTKKSADEMEVFGQRANEAAKALGKATTDYTEAALIYYQQGLSDEEVKARAETTLKAANVTGQATKTVSEQLTSVWNGFKVNAEQTEEYVDKLAAVAAISASNLEELSTGMSKVASAASNLGVDIDQLTAQISTIVSVTRQAPESVGTALKTIYARISDLKLGESDEDGLGLGDVSGGLQKLGIEVLDSEGELRDLGTVIEEVAAKWNTWTSAQQAAIAQLMAGKRQYNNLVALFSNWDMYTNAIETSRNATGELQKQQDIYMESTEAHIQQLKTQWEDLYDSVLDEDAIIGVTDALNGILTVITKIIDAVGGGSTLITGLLGTIINKFAPQITQQVIMPLIKNFQAKKYNDLIEGQLEANTRYAASQNGFGHEATQEMLKYSTEISKVWSSMTTEQKNESQEIIKQIGHWKEVQTGVEKTAAATAKYLKNLKGLNIKNLDKGIFNLSEADQKEALKALTNQKTKVDDIKKSYLDLQKIGKKITKDNNGNSILDPKDLDKADKLISGIKEKLKDLKNQGLISEDVYKRDEANLNRLFDRIDKIRTGKVTPKDTIFRESDVKVLQSLVDHLDIADSELQNYIQLMKEGKLTTEQAAEMQKKLADALNLPGKKAAQRTQNILQTIGAISQLASGVQSFANIMQTMGDTTVDAGEKIKDLFSSLIYMIPMFATSIITLSKTLEVAAPIVAGIALAIVAVVGAFSYFSFKFASARKEAAESAKNLADASSEVAQATKEEKDAIDELKTSYEALDKTSITYREDLRKLLIGHGKFSEAAQVATSSLEELDEMIKQLQEDANNKVIDSTTEQVERLKNAISADINANVLSEFERDDEISQTTGKKRQTIDLGGDTDVSAIKGILDQYGIDSSFGTGHIDLEQFVNAMVENEAALRKALQENNSDAARRLLEIMGSEQEMLTTTAEALTAKQEAQLSNIQNSVDISANGTFDEYDKAFNELKQKASGIFKDDKKAEEWAKKRIAESGTVGTAYASLTDEVKDIVRGIDKELTTSQLNYLNEHIDLYKAYGNDSAEAFLEGAKEVIDGQGKSNLLVSVSIGLGKDELTDEDITSLFANGPLGNLTEGEFKLFDAQKQKRELRKYFDELIEEQEIYNKETVTKQIQSLEEQKQAKEKAYNEIINIAKKYHLDEDNLDTIQKEKYIQHVKDRKAILVEDYQQQQEFINNTEKILQNNPDMVEEAAKSYRDAIQQAKQQQQQDIEGIQKLNNRIDASKELKDVNLEILKQYEATTQELEKQKAAIMANSKELASSIQDIELLEKAYKAGELTDTDYSERYKQLDRQRDIEGLDTEELEDYTKYLQETAKASDELADSLEEDGDAADIVAKSIMKMNKAIEELSDGFEEWSDVLQNSEESSEEYAQALNKIRASVADLLDISEDYVSKDYLLANLEDIGKAAEGDAEAIDRLRQALSQDVIMHFGLEDNIADELLNKVNYWQGILDSQQLQVGATLDDSSMIDALNEMIVAAGLTVDQVNALFDSMGFEANFAQQDTEMKGYTTLTTKHHTMTDKVKDPDTGQWAWTETEWVEQEPIEGTTKTPAFALSTDGKPPKINSITKKASGSMNNYSSKNAGGKKSSGGGSKGGGGKQPSKEKPLERDTDIYRVVNQELSQIESQLNNIDQINSHQWGANYKKTLEQQNVLLKQQTALLEKKNKLQIDDLATRRKQLEDEGLKFSEDGAIILNAEEYLNELYAEHNKLIDAHNNMTAAEQEVDKANLETSENRIKAVEKRIEEYEALRKEADDVYSKRLEQHYAEIENEVEIFNAEVDLHLELKDAEKEWNDFWKEVVEDVKDNDFAGQIAADMKQLDTLIGVNSGFEGSTGEALLTHIQKELAEVDKTIASAGEDGLFGDNIKLAYENLVKYRDQLMATLREAKEKLDHMAENYVKQLEYSWELIDKQVERFEAIGKHINHNIELIKLVDGEKAYDALDMQYENQYENNLQLLDTLNKSKDIAEQKMNEHKALMEQYAEGTTERETAAKAYESSVNEYLKITEQLDSTLENTLQSIKEQTENTNAKILDTLDKAMSGGIGLDLVEEEWKLINDEADKYYDNIERYINMEEYTHQLDEAADAIGLSAANQQKLNQFREEELKQLNEKERLTSYDIEESRARLEILKQELALQDAQANKSKMRLRRDSQGNYNYQYVADENAIEEAENGLLTAKKEWYSLVKKRYQDLSNDIISIQKQQLEYAKQIKDAESAGDIERLNKYKELYNQNAEYLKWAMTEAEKNKRDMYNGTQLYFKQVDDTTLEQSKTTVRQLVDQWTGEGEKSFTGAVKKAITDLDAAQETFKSKTATALSAAGVNYNNLKNNNIDPVLAKLNSLTDKNLFDKLSSINKELENQWKNLEKGATAYRTFREAAVGELGLVEKEITTLSQLITDMPSPKLETPSAGDAPKITYDKGTSNTNNNTSNETSPSGGTNPNGGNPQPPPEEVDNNTYLHIGGPSSAPGGQYPKYTIITGGKVTSQGTMTESVASGWKQGGSRQFANWDKDPNKTIKGYRISKIRGKSYPVNYSSNKVYQFRSGGYTGEWGSEGRLAILHQKELVLNENDTKNMLSAVQILRSIPYSVIAQSLINSSTNTASALSGINSGISGLAAAATNNESKTMVVNADFSGVHDADEIYQALLELENYGLQNSYSVAPHANSMY